MFGVFEQSTNLFNLPDPRYFTIEASVVTLEAGKATTVKECEIEQVSLEKYPSIFKNQFLAQQLDENGQSKLLTVKNPDEIVLIDNFENAGAVYL